MYWLGGDWGEQSLQQINDYIKSSIQVDDNAKLLVFWAGDGKQTLKTSKIPLSAVTVNQLEILRNTSGHRVKFV